MITVNGKMVDIIHFPDNTISSKYDISYPCYNRGYTIYWHYENSEEVLFLFYLVRHIQSAGVKKIDLVMPYIPNARQDRVKYKEDIFTLKYFAELINGLNFSTVYVLDPHSHVSEALINNIVIMPIDKYVNQTIEKLKDKGIIIDSLFYPDEGSMKRYSNAFQMPYTFGVKIRDWKTGQILDLNIIGDSTLIKDKNVLIIDDICSKGTTFFISASKLKELGAKSVYLYITHCENTIKDGKLLNSNVIDEIFTTDSLITFSCPKINVLPLQMELN